jgi:hypothetical protein
MEFQRGGPHDFRVAIEAHETRRQLEVSRELGAVRIVALETELLRKRRMDDLLITSRRVMATRTERLRTVSQHSGIVRTVGQVARHAAFILDHRIVEVVLGKGVEILVAIGTHVEETRVEHHLGDKSVEGVAFAALLVSERLVIVFRFQALEEFRVAIEAFLLLVSEHGRGARQRNPKDQARYKVPAEVVHRLSSTFIPGAGGTPIRGIQG